MSGVGADLLFIKILKNKKIQGGEALLQPKPSVVISDQDRGWLWSHRNQIGRLAI